MPAYDDFYSLCCRHTGRPVVIGTRDGNYHRGVIRGVRGNQVYLQPIGPYGGGARFGGYGYGGFRPGFGWGIAIGAIGTLVLLPFFI